MVVTLEVVEQYIETQRLAWSPTTMRSAKWTLSALVDVIDGNPDRLWKRLSDPSHGQAPYTRVTTWTRVTKFWDWLTKGEGTNEYSAFRRRNARLFKNTYQRRPARIGAREARARLALVQDPSARKKAVQLLLSGMRYTESGTLDDAGFVIGKGNKPREIVNAAAVKRVPGPDYTGTYNTFRRKLRNAGLKPHDLRKIHATALSQQPDVSVFDLCTLMGWDSIESAKPYIASRHKSALIQSISEALSHDGDDT